MKIFNLPRASGKTMRMLYASEFNNAPIITFSRRNKEELLYQAKRFGIKIPDPIAISELDDYKKIRTSNTNVLVDELVYVLQTMLKNKYNLNMIGCTLSDEENSVKMMDYEKGCAIDIL